MTARRLDQLWLYGGLALILLLTVAGWLLLIKPAQVEANSQREQAATFNAQVASVQSKFTGLQKKAEGLDGYMATLATYQAALPETSNDNDIPAFLRQLQALGTELNVDVSGYSAAGAETSAVSGTVKELPISLSASGKVANLSRFLTHLQNVQPRAVLIENASLTSSTQDAWELSLNLNAYITSSATVDLAELKKSLRKG